jgi:5-methylcytosine-specific restriction enzyme subunit McrC
MVSPPPPLVLPEFEERSFTRVELPDDVGERLWLEFGSSPGKRIEVEFPSPKTEGKWRLKNLGYVGLVPLGRERVLSLQPKVPIANVFRMLEYAYRLDAFRGPEDVVGARTMQEIYESLARVLARRVRDRGRKGLHRTYVGREERLGVIRGRLDLRRLPHRGPDPRLHCLFEEHTPDHDDNRILLDALDRVLRSGICRDQARREAREAHRLLRGAVTPAVFTERDVVSRSYNRLNHDYRGLHALARFFIAHTGPTQREGGEAMTPFLMNMAQLFEKFVASWLAEHLPAGLSVHEQESGSYDPEGEIGYQIDLVLYDDAGRPLAVLDTKYKEAALPASDDVAQVVSYAARKGCRQAVLVYPHALAQPRAFTVGEARVSTAAFPLDAAFESGGRHLLKGLVAAVESGSPYASAMSRISNE